jgi:hypothetical protein
MLPHDLDLEARRRRRQRSDLGSQGDAESWLGERWRDFADQGAAAAILLEDGRQVYRMELSAAEE